MTSRPDAPIGASVSFRSLNPHLRENYLRVCRAFNVEPNSADAPEELAMFNLDPLEREMLAKLREADRAR